MDQALRHQVVADARWSEEPRPRWAGSVFAVSLLLLGTSYILLLAAPLVTARLSGLAGEAPWATLAHWIPAASGAGLALGGGAALLLVLARLSKDIRQHPYACVAPALAAFAACVMVGLGAKLPLGPSEPLCVFALALSVMGGALVQESGVGSQVFGWSLAVAPPASLVAAVWAASGQAQLSGALWSLSPTSRLFLAMLALSSVSMALLGMVARTLTALQQDALRNMRVAATAQWNPHPFSEREETLDIALRSAERELRRRPLGRPALFAVCLVLAGTAVAVWQRSSHTEMSSSVLARAREVSQPAMVASGPGAMEPVPQVEPYVPPSAAPSLAVALEVPQPAREQDVEVVQPAHEESKVVAALAAEAPTEPSAPMFAENAVVVTSRSAHARRAHPTRALKQKTTASRAPSRAAKVAAPVPAEQEQSAVATKAVEARPSLREQDKEGKSAAVAAPPAAASSKSKPAAPTRGDESLDELMDRVVEAKPGKSAVSADDPIFGL